MLGLQEEGRLEVGENWAGGRPELGQGVEEAGQDWGGGEGVLGAGAPGGEGPTGRRVR